jgi:hypothetical protein
MHASVLGEPWKAGLAGSLLLSVDPLDVLVKAGGVIRAEQAATFLQSFCQCLSLQLPCKAPDARVAMICGSGGLHSRHSPSDPVHVMSLLSFAMAQIPQAAVSCVQNPNVNKVSQDG